MNDVRQIQKDQSTGNTNVEAWTIGDVYRNREMILAMRHTSTTLLGTSMVVATGKSVPIVPNAIAATVAVFLKGCLIGLF